MNYLEWNDALGKFFFNRKMAQSPVLLRVTPELFSTLGNDLNGFLRAIHVGPPWITTTAKNVCVKALQTYDLWQERGREYPPYLAYLALFALAGVMPGPWKESAYYPRLRELLAEKQAEAQYAGFPKMIELWCDLEHWANVEKQGELGLFRANINGNKLHVGLPFAQSLLTEEDSTVLTQVFAKAGLDPQDPASPEEIAALVLRLGKSLTKRTQSLLKSRTDSDLRLLLIDLIISELKVWDGISLDQEKSDVPDTKSCPKCERSGDISTVFGFRVSNGKTIPQSWCRACRNSGASRKQAPVITNSTDEVDNRRKHFANGVLKIVGKLRRPHRKFDLAWRCKYRLFQEEGFILSSDEQTITCTEEYPGWSQILRDDCTREPLNPAAFNWHEDIVLDSADGVAMFRQRYSPVHIMVEGTSLSPPLPDLVEVDRIPSTSFYIIAVDRIAPIIKKWGEHECSGFESVRIDSGLPRGWDLYRVESVHNDNHVRQLIPRLALPRELKSDLTGGLKPYPSKRNTFFRFAPPRLEAEGADRVFCERLDTGQISESKAICAVVPIARKVRLCVALGQTIKCYNIDFVDQFDWETDSPPNPLAWDRVESSETTAHASSGALFFGQGVPSYPLRDSPETKPQSFTAKTQVDTDRTGVPNWLQLAFSLDIRSATMISTAVPSRSQLISRTKLLRSTHVSTLMLSDKLTFLLQRLKSRLRQKVREQSKYELRIPEKSSTPVQIEQPQDLPDATENKRVFTRSDAAISLNKFIPLRRAQSVRTSLSLPLGVIYTGTIDFGLRGSRRSKSKPAKSQRPLQKFKLADGVFAPHNQNISPISLFAKTEEEHEA